VTQKYQALALRNLPPLLVFSQLALAFEVAKQNATVVAINIVGPEDGYYALHDYELHMRMIHFLKTQYPQVNLSLHAGELAFSQVPPEAFKYGLNIPLCFIYNIMCLLSYQQMMKVCCELI
jgi:adenosine deaminase/adenosine deaminase CECR1